jgi:aldehyde dehydrogenase (NAD+)/phenylacetaldehyde dehydrogenase
VVTEANNDMRICREKIFGPIITAIPSDDVDDVVRTARYRQRLGRFAVD